MRGKILRASLIGFIVAVTCSANAGMITESKTISESGKRGTEQNHFSWLFNDLSTEIDEISLSFSWAGMDFTDTGIEDDKIEYLDIYAGLSNEIGFIGDYDNTTKCSAVPEVLNESNEQIVKSWSSDCSGNKTFLLDDATLWSNSELSIWAHNVNEGDSVGVQSNGLFQDKDTDPLLSGIALTDAQLFQGFITATISYEAVAESASKAEAVPEPSTLAIFALGVMGLMSRRFKNQS